MPKPDMTMEKKALKRFAVLVIFMIVGGVTIKHFLKPADVKAAETVAYCADLKKEISMLELDIGVMEMEANRADQAFAIYETRTTHYQDLPAQSELFAMRMHQPMTNQSSSFLAVKNQMEGILARDQQIYKKECRH